MDLKNNTVTVREILAYPSGKKILNRNFPIVMLNPFLLKSAIDMSLTNMMKMAKGPDAELQKDKLIYDLEAL